MGPLAPISTAHAISSDNFSSRDNNYASSNVVHVLHWDPEGRYGNTLSVVSFSNDLAW